MIKLLELLRIVDIENKEGFISIDDWRWSDIDHLMNMGFEFEDDYRFHTNKPPFITIYKKKEETPQHENLEFFYVEEEGRDKKRFQSFNDVIDYFDNYSQPELDKNR